MPSSHALEMGRRPRADQPYKRSIAPHRAASFSGSLAAFFMAFRLLQLWLVPSSAPFPVNPAKARSIPHLPSITTTALRQSFLLLNRQKFSNPSKKYAFRSPPPPHHHSSQHTDHRQPFPFNYSSISSSHGLIRRILFWSYDAHTCIMYSPCSSSRYVSKCIGALRLRRLGASNLASSRI